MFYSIDSIDCYNALLSKELKNSTGGVFITNIYSNIKFLKVLA